MADLREQRDCIQFCFKLRKNDAETHQILRHAFGDNNLYQTQTYDWYKRFKNGRTSTDDGDRSGRPSTAITRENVAEVMDLILQDRRLPIQDLYKSLGLSYGTCQRILSDELNMRRIAGKFVSRLLQNEQKASLGSLHGTSTDSRGLKFSFEGYHWLRRTSFSSPKGKSS
jgi:hypothetical protein